MPNSYKDFTGTPGASVSFTNTDLKYLETAHLRIETVTTAGVSAIYLQTDAGQNGSAPPFTVSQSGGTTTITFSNMVSGWDTNVNKIRVFRVTPSDNLLTNFQNASLLRAEDLNANSEQLLFVLQEQLDQGVGSLPLNAEGNFTAGNRQIVDMADGSSDKDAATFGQLSAFAAFSGTMPSVAQSYSFDLGTGGDGTHDGGSPGNTTFSLSPAPLSEVDDNFIVEVDGVLQSPGADFTVSGTVLTIVGANLTDAAFTGSKLRMQGFGIARNTIQFPLTVTAANATDTSLTMKGTSSGDSTAIETRTGSNVLSAEITHNGVIRAGTIEPLTSGSLTAKPTSIEMGGTTITPTAAVLGGTVSAAGAISGTTMTLSSADPAPGDATPTRVVTKAYVDAYGGNAGGSLSPSQNLNSLVTAGLFTGTVPANATSLNYPTEATQDDLVALRVLPLGGSNNQYGQELTIQANNRKFTRTRGGGVWSAWEEVATHGSKLSEFAAPTLDLNINSNKLINVTDPTAAQDAATKAYVDAQEERVKLGTWTGSGDGTLSDAVFNPPAGDSFMNYRKLEMQFEHVGRLAAGYPTNSFYKDLLYSLNLYQVNASSTGSDEPGYDKLGFGAGTLSEANSDGITTPYGGHDSADFGLQVQLIELKQSSSAIAMPMNVYGSVCIYPNYTWERYGTTGQYARTLVQWKLYGVSSTASTALLGGGDGYVLYSWFTSTDGTWPTAAPSLDRMVLRARGHAPVDGSTGPYNQFTDGKITLYGYKP